MMSPNSHARFDLTLSVIAQTPHWRGSDGKLWADEPFVREMRVWADLFAQVRICAPVGKGARRGNLTSYDRTNLRVEPVHFSLTRGLCGICQRVAQFPGMVRDVRRTILNSDFTLVFSPNYMAAVGAALVRHLRRASISKWTGDQVARFGECLPVFVDRHLEDVPDPRHPVLVYGPPQRPHQIEVLTALMTEAELLQAQTLGAQRAWQTPWQLLSVGRLEPVNNFALALRGLGELTIIQPGLDWHYTLVGDGPARGALEVLARQQGIAGRVTFAGALSFAATQRRYATAHIVIVPGTLEDWPTIIAAAWAHGAVPLVAADGRVPWLLPDAEAGSTFVPTPVALAAELGRLFSAPARLQAQSETLYPRAAGLSLEKFQTRLEQVLCDRCGLKPQS